VSPFLPLVLLIRNIANTIDITAINVAVRKVRSYDSGDGNEAEILFVSDSIITWFACKNVPAITGLLSSISSKGIGISHQYCKSLPEQNAQEVWLGRRALLSKCP
jgi:hypothetical protein